MSNNHTKSDQKILLESGTNEVEFLEFYLGSGCYGVNVAKVAQVLVFNEGDLSDLPGEKEKGVLGAMMFQGQPILVVDLAEMIFSGNSKMESSADKKLLLVLEFNRRRTGFLVHNVDSIKRASWKDFQETDETNVGAQTQWVTGVVASEGKVTMILDFEAILASIVPSTSPERFVDHVTTLSASSDKELNIVYCEDSELVQKVALKAFKQAGIENVKVFTSGKQGLEYLINNKDNPVDLVISDIEMPEMDGLTFCKKLKTYPDFKSVPVVFFSSTINDQMRVKCESVGGIGAFSKPEINELLSSIDNILS